jgi:hypothetical protein
MLNKKPASKSGVAKWQIVREQLEKTKSWGRGRSFLHLAHV